MPALVEIAQMVLGSGVLTGALAYGARHVPAALADARRKAAEAKRLEAEAKRLEAEAERLAAEQARAWEENTGRIYKDQRKDIEQARQASADCEERIQRLAVDCAAQAAECKARIEAQDSEIEHVRAALRLHEAALQKLTARADTR